MRSPRSPRGRPEGGRRRSPREGGRRAVGGEVFEVALRAESSSNMQYYTGTRFLISNYLKILMVPR